MCNLYSITRSQEAIRRLFRVKRDLAGNLPVLPAIYPDTTAPVIRTARDGERELTMMRWGFPPPPNLGNAPVTNVRNLKSPYWRGWLKAEWRCLVPASSFCEWTDSRPKVAHWFAIDESRPLFAFAGIWRLWTGERRGETGEHRLFAFLTRNRMPWCGRSTQRQCQCYLQNPMNGGVLAYRLARRCPGPAKTHGSKLAPHRRERREERSGAD